MCQFASGTSARFDADWDVKAASDRLSFTFEGIDATRAKARIVSPFGMSEVLLFKGNNSLNFLEIMPDGNQAFTTVFFSHRRDGKGHQDWIVLVSGRSLAPHDDRPQSGRLALSRLLHAELSLALRAGIRKPAYSRFPAPA